MPRLTVEYEWGTPQELHLVSDKLVFPRVPATPAIYAMRFEKGARSCEYVGEAADLRRRLNGYRNPRPTQRTNLRMNPELRQVLAGGGHVTLRFISSARVRIDGRQPAELDMAKKTERLLVESAALVASALTSS